MSNQIVMVFELPVYHEYAVRWLSRLIEPDRGKGSGNRGLLMIRYKLGREVRMERSC